MRIIFFGTPHFAATILEFLNEQPVEIAAVISRPDKPKGRSGKPQPTPVKQIAQRLGLHLYQPKKASEPEFAALLQSHDADLFIVAAYAEILKENILSIPPLGCINVHGSILPKYRGAAPIQRALMAGEKETGVSIMKMALEMDAGDIYSIVKLPISDEETTGDLMERMAREGGKELWEVIKKIESNAILPTPQDHSQATFAPKVRPEEGEVNWNRPAKEIHNHIRGMTPNPGAWCWVEVRGDQKRLNLKMTRLFPDFKGNPGQIAPMKGKLVIACGQGALELLQVQLEGKKTLSSDAFLCGIPSEDLKF